MSQGRLQGKTATYLGPTWDKEKPKPKRVYIEDHTLYVNGRLSNWVTFRYIKKDGTLGAYGGDYDFDKENFVNVKPAKLIVY